MYYIWGGKKNPRKILSFRKQLLGVCWQDFKDQKHNFTSRARFLCNGCKGER